MIVSIIAILVLRYVYAKQGIFPQLAGRGKLIRIVEKQMLMPQKMLYLVEVAGKFALLGVAENRIEFLMEVEPDRITQVASSPGGPVEAPELKEYLDKFNFPKPVQFLFSRILEEKKK